MATLLTHAAASAGSFLIRPGTGSSAMPQSIPKGLTREHVLKALADLDAGIEHPFGKPTGYELVHDGKHYPPKAVIGIACRHMSGEILHPSNFSGGEQPGQANYELRKLGFQVVGKLRKSRKRVPASHGPMRKSG